MDYKKPVDFGAKEVKQVDLTSRISGYLSSAIQGCYYELQEKVYKDLRVPVRDILAFDVGNSVKIEAVSQLKPLDK